MNSPAIRFGALEFITMEGEIEVTESETIHDYDTTGKSTRRVHKILATSRKQVIAEMLKLADRLNEDEVCDIAFECVKKRNSASPFQLQVSWTSK